MLDLALSFNCVSLVILCCLYTVLDLFKQMFFVVYENLILASIALRNYSIRRSTLQLFEHTIYSVYESESRTPDIRKSRSPNVCWTPDLRKSRSPKVSCGAVHK